MWRRRTIELADGRMAALEFGAPEHRLAVIFLHANGFNALTYRQVLERLAADMRGLAVDMRGYGMSELPIWDDARGWQCYADDLVDLVAALGERPRVLAGHSMGGTACLLAARRLGVDRLVLFDPVVAPADLYGAGPAWDTGLAAGALRRKHFFPDRQAALDSYRGRGAFKTWPDEVLGDYLQDGLRPTPEGFTLACKPRWEAANFAGFAMVDPRPALAEYSGVLSVLRAEMASTCFLEVDDPRIETVPGTTHFLPIERPDLVQDVIRKNVLF